MVVIGLRLGASTSSNGTTASGLAPSSNAFSLGLAPYVEWRPVPDATVQPFVAVEGGVAYGYSRQRVLTTLFRTHRVTPSVGARVGAHAFVLPRLSIDVGFGVAHAWSIPVPRSQSQSIGYLTVSQEHTKARSVQVAASLGISGWF